MRGRLRSPDAVPRKTAVAPSETFIPRASSFRRKPEPIAIGKGRPKVEIPRLPRAGGQVVSVTPLSGGVFEVSVVGPTSSEFLKWIACQRHIKEEGSREPIKPGVSRCPYGTFSS